MKKMYLSKTSTGDLCPPNPGPNPGIPCGYCWWYGKNPCKLFPACLKIPILSDDGVDGGDNEPSFFKLKFSGVASSGAESTSKSDSGELGGPLRFGDNSIGIWCVKFFIFILGLLGDDSDPVSWSVSVEILCLFVPENFFFSR